MSRIRVSATVDEHLYASYGAYDETALDTADEWGDLAASDIDRLLKPPFGTSAP